MGESPRVKKSFVAATRFLDPVLQREEIQKHRGKSLLDILLGATIPETGGDDVSKRRTVIGKALEILDSVHTAFVTPLTDADKEAISQSAGDTEDAALEDAKRRRLLHALLDLISLEGIYPSLSGGVAIPLQKRVISVLPAGVIAQQDQAPVHEKPQDETLLEQIMLVLTTIVFDSRPSIQPVVRGRILSDMVSGLADLGHNSIGLSVDNQTHYRHGLTKLIEETSSTVVLSTLSPFLQSDPAPWFKSVVSGFLSRVPLRPDGVLQTMIFLASQLAPSLGVESQTQASNGPHFTVQAIMQTSRLLSSVPQGMDPDEYFTTVAPQLLDLIDGEDPDLRRTAAYVVGNGILSKRPYGSRGTIGHSIFLVPIFETLTASLSPSSRLWLTSKDESNQPEQVLVDDAVLTLAIDRLTALVLQPPNPGLVKRIVHPVLLPLWGLACYTLEHQQKVLHEKVLTILQAYFGLSGGLEPLKKLVDNLLWDGGPAWTYGMQSQHSISLVKRDSADLSRNIVRLVDDLQSRAKLFLSVLGADPSSEERTGDIFLYVSERWLVKPSNEPKALNSLKLTQEEDDSSNIIQKLISAKLAETLLDNFKDTLSRRPHRVLELIQQIIDGELHGAYTHKKKATNTTSGKVSLSSLSSIVNTEETQHEASTESDSAESLPAVFSLLSTVLASPEFTTSPETVPVLESIKSKLDELIPYLPPSLSKPGTTASMLAEIQLMSSNEQSSSSSSSAAKTSSEVSDFETHRRALTNLNSDLPPIQAEGFSLLSTLIKKSSPVLDIPATLTLLLSILTDPSDQPLTNDEFVYLNAINLIGTLASRHPRTVLKTLVDRYIDRNEASGTQVDQRLKIGESLLRTVQDLGEALTGEAARLLGEGMITVAGRRAHKPEAQKARRDRLAAEQRKQEREARKKAREAQEIVLPSGWSLGPSSPAPQATADPNNTLIDDNDTDDETSPEQLAQYENIIAAWAAGSKSDAEPDDLRVRASALSILATAMQTNILGLGPAIVGAAVDLALATLTMEPEPESAILRRASAVLLLDVLKAMDAVREEKGTEALGFGFSLAEQGAENQARESVVGNIPRMLRTLRFVESWETDAIVRGHVRVVVESLEAWLEKALMWGIGAASRSAGEDDEPRMELGDRIAGLRIDPLAGRREASLRPRIEEIE
ncbi:RTP1/Tango6 family protein [Aspergillus homomorphus CBS 101889]|uniref:Protein required for cell viability n=1 Tax=Aspergillus homomorphus (strain CBS 101889) TaxID=1450537 RepID=A0A395HZ39_ASPHC|nr:protein required for cell viability [Aspergillus homomorphus CBS 101889]RAL12957.1 protein required for cell viability [Aspergillus homomorphus CBS 101889]